jgi:hypothetical protein
MFRKLVWFAVIYTFVVVVVGAYVRLSDAGLGCPDWPGCYGELTPHHAQDDIAKAVEEQGGTHGPVSLGKAWKEMFHRYIAGGLGLVILAIAVTAWLRRRELQQSPLLATSLVGLVAFQAALGMWTVTMLLKPVIVTLHLLGGLNINTLNPNGGGQCGRAAHQQHFGTSLSRRLRHGITHLAGATVSNAPYRIDRFISRARGHQHCHARQQARRGQRLRCARRQQLHHLLQQRLGLQHAPHAIVAAGLIAHIRAKQMNAIALQ